jgi:hypothetical protein
MALPGQDRRPTAGSRSLTEYVTVIQNVSTKLAALRSFYRYAALEAPQHAGMIQRVLSIPYKQISRRMVDYLTRSEVEDRRVTALLRRDGNEVNAKVLVARSAAKPRSTRPTARANPVATAEPCSPDQCRPSRFH